MKIALATYFPEDPLSPMGGVEAVSVNLAAALGLFEDLEIHMVTFSPRVSAPDMSAWNGIALHRLPALPGSVLANAVGPGRRSLSRYITALRPDLVHAHDTFGLMVKGLPIPRVFTIHGFIYGDTLVSGVKWPRMRSWIWRRVETRGWADQPHIISISPYVRERLGGIATGVIHDIDNPISESFFLLSRKEEQEVIFSAAVVSPRKNTHVLVEALSHLVKMGVRPELRLAGGIVDPDYENFVKIRIEELGLREKVVWLGRISSADVARELQGAGLFALVSLEENSPMGIEEAMAAGVPVVTSNRCGMPYMVRHGETGYLVNPHDPAEVAARMAKILTHRELRNSMGRKAREVALDRFHPRRVAAATRDVYYEALGSSPPETSIRMPAASNTL